MRKTKLIFTLLPLLILLFLSSVRFSYAQTQSSLFNLSNIVLQQQIAANTKNVQLLKLPPFTTIIIKPRTFNQDTIVFVYGGDFDNIKAALPSDQSPISSYYLIFKTIKGFATTPLLPLNVQSYNNFSNTNTFYYSIDPSEKIDSKNMKTWNGNILVNVNLPLTASGFIVTTNKNLDKNDQALNAGKAKLAPGANPKLQNSPVQNGQNELLLTIGALIIVIGVFVGLFRLLWKKQKRKRI